MANLVNIRNFIIVLFILNSLPCSDASDSNIDYSCHKEIPSPNSKNRKYIQLCDKIVHADIGIACEQHDASVASQEQLDNVVFNNPENVDTSEFWIASESSNHPDTLGKSNNSGGENDLDRLSYDGKRINKNGKAIKHSLVCEQDEPFTKMTKYFECPNDKLWRTFDLTDRGEYCLGTTARSKLECLVFSQQHKCPHAFYEMTTNTCQLFYKKISNLIQTKQLDCSNNFCYTCV